MVDPSNAGKTKKGFNYQDVVALCYFIKDIDKLRYVNVEGKEDVDLMYSDGKRVFIQVKMADNVLDTKRSTVLKDALRVLINDFSSSPKPNEIIYLTNSHYPFAHQKDFDFSKDYVKYSYNQFNNQIKNKIDKQVRNLSKEVKNNRIQNQFINELDQNNINEILTKFSVVKLRYEGADDESKLLMLDERIEEFLLKASFHNKLKEPLRNEWYFMFSRSSEDAKKKITLENFVAHTFVTVSICETDDEQFFKSCNIDLESMNYIQSQNTQLKHMFLSKFGVQSTITKLFYDYKRENSDASNLECLIQFINENLDELSKVLDLNISTGDKVKIDTVKYMAWVIIFQSHFLNKIKEITNYED
jgi:hypothetical protein